MGRQNFLLMTSFAAMLFSYTAMILSGFALLRDQIPLDVKDSIKNRPMVRQLAYYVFDPTTYTRTGQEIGDGGPPTGAVLKDPTGIYVNAQGDIFFCERRHHRIRKISQGTISTVAGYGWRGFSRDGIQASRARVSYP